MIEQLISNIDKEIEMAREIGAFYSQASSPQETRLIEEAVESLLRRIKMVNDSIPEIIAQLSSRKTLDGKERTSRIEKVRMDSGDIFIKKDARRDFAKELNISENLFSKLGKHKKVKEKPIANIPKPSSYAKFSNKFFLETSERWLQEGKLKSLSLDLRRSNSQILTSSYVSMMVMSTIIGFFAGILLTLFLLFFKVSLLWPFVSLYSGSILLRLAYVSWLIVVVPLLTLLLFYIYPSAERGAIAKRIDSELPFVVIHMGSISGSGIEPLSIFKIVGNSKEYKYAGKEIRKILNQTAIYGYDLTTALRNVARITPSKKFSELLNGMSVTINSGGELKGFFEKRAESLMLEYRIEREKFSKIAETFMDIYISIVIATPMILMLLLVVISVAVTTSGFGINELTVAIIGIVAIINVIFLVVLHIKQPNY